MKVAKYVAFSARTGAKYPESTSATLGDIAARCKFTSPYWITLAQSKHFIGTEIKPNAEGFPITFNFDGVDRQVTLFNIEQMTDPKQILRHIENVTLDNPRNYNYLSWEK